MEEEDHSVLLQCHDEDAEVKAEGTTTTCRDDDQRRGIKRLMVEEGGTTSSANLEQVIPTRRNTQAAWSICFAQSATLKTFLENIANLLSECNFEVVCNADFQGLSVERLDNSRCCLVQARMSGQVTVATPGVRHSFCLRMSNLLSCLRNAHPCHFVDIWSPEGSTDVVLRVHEPQVSSYTPTFTLRTLAVLDEAEDMMPTMEYELFVEIDLNTFQSVMKTAKNHKADTAEIYVYGLRSRAPDATDPIITYFVISYTGDEVSSQFPFQSSTEPPSAAGASGEPLVIRASTSVAEDYEGLPPQDELDTIYSGVFGIEYLFLATRSMERHALTLRLGRDKPLLMEFPLGSGKTDYLRCILAPKFDNSA